MKNETIRKMQEIRLSAMAEAFEIQLQQPERFEQLSLKSVWLSWSTASTTSAGTIT